VANPAHCPRIELWSADANRTIRGLGGLGDHTLWISDSILVNGSFSEEANITEFPKSRALEFSRCAVPASSQACVLAY
jgi:hypothetical protein